MLELRALRDDDEAALGDEEPLSVGDRIVTDDHARGNFHVFIDDRPANARVAADLHALEEDRVDDLRVAVDAAAETDDGAVDAGLRDGICGALLIGTRRLGLG